MLRKAEIESTQAMKFGKQRSGLRGRAVAGALDALKPNQSITLATQEEPNMRELVFTGNGMSFSVGYLVDLKVVGNCCRKNSIYRNLIFYLTSQYAARYYRVLGHCYSLLHLS